MYSKEELLIFSFINSNYDISVQNLMYKISFYMLKYYS